MCLFVPVVSAVVQSPTVVIDLLRQVRADEIIDDTMNNRVVACGNLAFTPGGVRIPESEIVCDRYSRTLIIRDRALHTEDRIATNIDSCEGFVRARAM